MFRARHWMIAAGALLLFVWGVLLTSAESIAQNSCRSACWQAYGACYKATNSRPRCQGLLKRCLDGCLGRKREKR